VAWFIRVIDTAFVVYYWLLIIRILLSWVPQLMNTAAVRPLATFVIDITEPFLTLFRRLIPALQVGGTGIDFSPLIAIITLEVLRNVVVGLLATFF
jgi:YggT family protein